MGWIKQCLSFNIWLVSQFPVIYVIARISTSFLSINHIVTYRHNTLFVHSYLESCEHPNPSNSCYTDFVHLLSLFALSLDLSTGNSTDPLWKHSSSTCSNSDSLSSPFHFSQCSFQLLGFHSVVLWQSDIMFPKLASNVTDPSCFSLPRAGLQHLQPYVTMCLGFAIPTYFFLELVSASSWFPLCFVHSFLSFFWAF